MNQLTDISLADQYAGLCGISEEELNLYFQDEMNTLAKKKNLTPSQCLERLKETYDGYRFHPFGVSVFNPTSLLNAFYYGEFGSYWYETGTPSFLIKILRRHSFDVQKFSNKTLYASESLLKDYTGDFANPLPLLYQSGYLTIVDYDSRRNRYTLGFPNMEVKYGFLESLIPSYVTNANPGNGLDIYTLEEYVENGECDKIRDVLIALFANITYTEKANPFEHYFQTVIYLVFTLLGKNTVCELHTFSGRIDCRVLTSHYIYLFEFKRDDTAAAALSQIDSKDYTLPFIADSRKLFKIGVSFDSATRKLIEWKVAE